MAKLNVEILACESSPLRLLCLRRRELISQPGMIVTEVTLNHEFLGRCQPRRPTDVSYSRGTADVNESGQLTTVFQSTGPVRGNSRASDCDAS
jgi:hypothetical protein